MPCKNSCTCFRMYLRKAVLDHLPISMIKKTGTPVRYMAIAAYRWGSFGWQVFCRFVYWKRSDENVADADDVLKLRAPPAGKLGFKGKRVNKKNWHYGKRGGKQRACRTSLLLETEQVPAIVGLPDYHLLVNDAHNIALAPQGHQDSTYPTTWTCYLTARDNRGERRAWLCLTFTSSPRNLWNQIEIK